jgi:predicted MPP superfamily phosphohydrolase
MHPWLTEPLTIERVTIPIQDLPLSLHGKTIVQLSDFHFDGQSLTVELLKEAIASSNALTPDLIVLAGDFITRSIRDIHALQQFLA